MTRRYDTLVLGAGILGAAAAYRLACAGRRVAIVEAREPGQGTSGNSFAWPNAVRKEPEAYHRLNADGMAAYERLGDELGVDIGYRQSGNLEWGETEAEQAELRARVERLAARGYPARQRTGGPEECPNGHAPHRDHRPVRRRPPERGARLLPHGQVVVEGNTIVYVGRNYRGSPTVRSPRASWRTRGTRSTTCPASTSTWPSPTPPRRMPSSRPGPR